MIELQAADLRFIADTEGGYARIGPLQVIPLTLTGTVNQGGGHFRIEIASESTAKDEKTQIGFPAPVFPSLVNRILNVSEVRTLATLHHLPNGKNGAWWWDAGNLRVFRDYRIDTIAGAAEALSELGFNPETIWQIRKRPSGVVRKRSRLWIGTYTGPRREAGLAIFTANHMKPPCILALVKADVEWRGFQGERKVLKWYGDRTKGGWMFRWDATERLFSFPLTPDGLNLLKYWLEHFGFSPANAALMPLPADCE